MTGTASQQQDTSRAWAMIVGGLAACSGIVPWAIGRRYGTGSGCRAVVGLGAALVLQQRVVRQCRNADLMAHQPDLADALTLSRGVAAAWLAALCAADIRDRTGLAGRLGWSALLWGETISDWLDGPLARRRGGTQMGSVLDLEADSWLTLWAAIAAVRCGGLPAWYGLAPSLRYLLLRLGEKTEHTALFPIGDRVVGVAQMGLITITLCPWLGEPARTQARRAAPVIAAASLTCVISRQLGWPPPRRYCKRQNGGVEIVVRRPGV